MSSLSHSDWRVAIAMSRSRSVSRTPDALACNPQVWKSPPTMEVSLILKTTSSFEDTANLREILFDGGERMTALKIHPIRLCLWCNSLTSDHPPSFRLCQLMVELDIFVMRRKFLASAGHLKGWSKIDL